MTSAICAATIFSFMFLLSSILNAANAKTTLEAGLQAIFGGQTSIDLSPVTVVDSSAVAILLAWQRAVSEQGKARRFNGIPGNLLSLAELYGVGAMLHH